MEKKYLVVEEDIDHRKIYSYEYEGITYFLEDAWVNVIDDLSESGCIELSHIELLGYRRLKSYDIGTAYIDLTWMDAKDDISLAIDKETQKILMNSSNMKNASFYGKGTENATFYFEVVVDSNFFDTIMNLKSFIENNKKEIFIIKYQNVENFILREYISHLCKKSDVDVTFGEKLDNFKTLRK